MDEYDIHSYGIGMTTLEEVFIKCNGENEGSKKSATLSKKPTVKANLSNGMQTEQMGTARTEKTERALMGSAKIES